MSKQMSTFRIIYPNTSDTEFLSQRRGREQLAHDVRGHFDYVILASGITSLGVEFKVKSHRDIKNPRSAFETACLVQSLSDGVGTPM